MKNQNEVIMVENNLEKTISEILKITFNYNDKLIFEGMKNNDYSSYENLINNYLSKINEIDIDFFYSDNYRKYNDILKFFDPFCKTPTEKNLFNIIDGDAECIVENLVIKLLDKYYTLPVTAEELIKCSFSSVIEPKDYNYLFIRIVIRLSILYTVYKKEK